MMEGETYQVEESDAYWKANFHKTSHCIRNTPETIVSKLSLRLSPLAVKIHVCPQCKHD